MAACYVFLILPTPMHLTSRRVFLDRSALISRVAILSISSFGYHVYRLLETRAVRYGARHCCVKQNKPKNRGQIIRAGCEKIDNASY